LAGIDSTPYDSTSVIFGLLFVLIHFSIRVINE
jgi:hypothetical protein